MMDIGPPNALGSFPEAPVTPYQTSGQPPGQAPSQLPSDPPREPPGDPGGPVIKRRGTIACRRCRRHRTKCIHRNGVPPCDACVLAGPVVASECEFPIRGTKDVDRQFRRRPVEGQEKNLKLAPPVNMMGSGTQLSSPSSLQTQQSLPPIPPIQVGQLAGERNSWASPPHSPGRRSPASLTPSFASPGRFIGLPGFVFPDDSFPPNNELVEGCQVFVTSYFQLGFIPKAVFLENLRANSGSVGRFLLSCILAISARFTPCLVARYGDARKATEYFLQIARTMVPAEMYKPSLERLQAFFLLAISQWGNDDRERASMDMGVAVRMAALLKLDREDSYTLPSEGCSMDQVVKSESARRVFWMIQSQENLHSGYRTPAPFPLKEVTTLLPCSEEDFAFAVIPSERAAEIGTAPALANPDLVNSPQRCLFATLIQAHGLWGRVSRTASQRNHGADGRSPWDVEGEFQKMLAEMRDWEAQLPPMHTFSVWNLRGWKSECLHIAYLTTTMVVRLSNIVARRVYLREMLAHLTDEPPDQTLDATMGHAASPVAAPTTSSAAPPDFWERTSFELFYNVWELHQQIDAYFNMKSPGEGFPEILVFCVYMCGSLSSYLWRYPALCPRFGEKGEKMAQRCLEVLGALHDAWPTSSNWQKGLQQIATPLTGVSPPTPGAATLPQPQQQQPMGNITLEATLPPPNPVGMSSAYQTPRSMERRPTVPGGMLEELINVLPQGSGNLLRLGSMQMNVSPSELFDAELAAFVEGNFQYDLWDGWSHPGLTAPL